MLLLSQPTSQLYEKINLHNYKNWLWSLLKTTVFEIKQTILLAPSNPEFVTQNMNMKEGQEIPGYKRHASFQSLGMVTL